MSFTIPYSTLVCGGTLLTLFFVLLSAYPRKPLRGLMAVLMMTLTVLLWVNWIPLAHLASGSLTIAPPQAAPTATAVTTHHTTAKVTQVQVVRAPSHPVKQAPAQQPASPPQMSMQEVE